MSTRPGRHRAGAALLAALTVLLASGAGFRALARMLGGSPGPPAPRGTLAGLPLALERWTGRDVPLEASVIEAADADDYVNRVYVHPAQNLAVGLYAALGVRARDLVPHRPEVCYPGAGWTLRDSRARELPLADGTRLQTRLYTFAPGQLDGRPLLVLNYYLIDGQSWPDVSQLRARVWRGRAGLRYITQIQITCRVEPVFGDAAALEAVCRLAQLSALPLRAVVTPLDQAHSSAAGLEEPR